jgi:pimeloyl-ACP methyl ester carboxylesterase
VLAPPALRTLAGRFDPEVFDVGARRALLRLEGEGVGRWDVVLQDGAATVQETGDREPDARLIADAATWESVAADLRDGMAAFRAGRLTVRRDLHLAVGFLAATAAQREEGGLVFRRVETSVGELSTMEAGQGPPVVLLHGLGATKASFLPTLGALAPTHRVIAVDLPGFGDSVKPVWAAYDAAFFARSVVALLDALDLERATIVGNSMGGRVALEVGLAAAQRVDRLVLLAPALAWRRSRPWAPLLRLVVPQLGIVQPAPRVAVEAIVRRVIPDADSGWTAAGVDEFLRSFLEPRGRAAFYAAARSIYLDEPHGPTGFWTRLPALAVPSMFVWGTRDRLVPIAFAPHVRVALPGARQLELECGHVPQLERPQAVHAAMARFLGEGAPAVSGRAAPARARAGRAPSRAAPARARRSRPS